MNEVEDGPSLLAGFEAACREDSLGVLAAMVGKSDPRQLALPEVRP